MKQKGSYKEGAISVERVRKKQSPSQRQLRVAEEIRHILADLFMRSEFRDPDLVGEKLTVTEVKVSPDLRRAVVYVVRLGRNDAGQLLPALRRVSPFLRGQLGQKIRLKFLPELHFEADITLDYAGKIDQLLHSPEVARDLSK